jgi:hypothetical protein
VPAVYQRRILDDELDEIAPLLPAIALEGPKGVGKTATAQRRARTVLALDDPDERLLLQSDLTRLRRAAPPVLIDEWQRHPPVWDVVRRLVDDEGVPGRFLLTGSATPARDVPLHSGAGRIVTVRMRPFALAERSMVTPTVSLRDLMAGTRPDIGGESVVRLPDYVDEILRSGLPEIRDVTGRARRIQLDAYLDRVVTRDFPELGFTVRRPAALRAWLRAYAAATATTTSYSAILAAATSDDGDVPSLKTTRSYTETLAQLWLLDPVEAWYPTRNHLRRLAHPSKHHLADPALAARLLGVDADALLSGREAAGRALRDGPLAGALFESLVTLSVKVYAQAAEARVSHLRTRAGEHEVDLIVSREDQRVVALEVKLTSTVSDRDVRHLTWLREQIGDDLLDAVVVTTGPYAYRRPDGIAVVPAALLGP